MLVFVYIFFLAFAISFVGSLQPGPVNLAVLTSSSLKQYKNAMSIAIGGSLPEFLFCFIAFKASYLIIKWHQLFYFFQIAMTILLLVLGLFLWFNKSNVTLKVTKRKGFLLGTALAILNPQLIIFWTTVITYIHVNNLFYFHLEDVKYAFFYFCAGATLGAFSLHCLLIYLSKKFFDIPLKIFFNYADKTIALIFVILAIIQIIKLF
jgi:threonine/homoserine/homoserine lactone efflux protein